MTGMTVESENTSLPSAAPEHAPALHFDVESFREYRADFEMTEAEWAELLEVLWPIMVAFADYGLGMHPLQHVLGLHVDAEILAPDSSAMLASQDSSTKNNNDMAASRRSRRRAGKE